jgi:uncharacterized protein YndB with AHSA1/START domain
MRRHGTYEKIMIALAAIVVMALSGAVIRAIYAPAVKIETWASFDAPAEVVWEFISESEKRLRWQTGITDVIGLTGDEIMLGSRFIVIKHIGPDRWELEEEILRFEPPRLWMVLQSTAQYFSTIRVEIEPGQSGTRLNYSEEKTYSSFYDRVMAPLTAHRERRAIEKALSYLRGILPAAVPAPAGASGDAPDQG